MKAQARIARYNQKHNDTDEDEFKKAFIQSLMKDPIVMEYAMKNDPEAMSRLLKRYGLSKE